MGDKFILDSNIWISYIITDSLDDLIHSIVQNQVEVFEDEHLLVEIGTVLSRLKFRKYLCTPVSKFMEVIELAVIMVETKSVISNLRIQRIIS